jgi:two-component system, cell cycle sensor histidine kinase and response regulator CckA
MTEPVSSGIRLLILEDVPEDAELEERALRDAGLSFLSRRVDTHADFVAALDSFHPDLIIADYNLPDIDGLTAVRLVRQRDAELPVVLVTGVLEDEAAVAVVKAGANDFVRKDRLARLPLAVEGALAVAANQRALRQSRQEIEDLYNHAPVGHHSVDRDLTIVLINDTELAWLGYRRDEVVGKMRFVDLLTPDSAAKVVQQSFPQLLETGSFHDVELDLVRKDGTILPALLNSTSVAGPDGSFVRSRTTVYDNTRLKAAEEQQRRLQAELDQSRRLEAVGQLSAGIAHDFNNVLQGIMSNLELVDDDLEVSPAARENIGSAVRLAEQAGELIHNLLYFARKQLLVPHEVDLDEFLNRFQRLLSRTLDPRIRIEVASEPGLAPVWVDARHLQTALLNLAINSRDAMPSGGNLRIEALGNYAAAASGQVGAGADAGSADRRRRWTDRCAIIRVSDTGTGIAPKDLSRVCEPFFSTKGLKGTGLGLSMVHGFAKQSGGDLRISSAPGKGTSVEIWLPMAPSQPGAEPALANSYRLPSVNRSVLSSM